MTVSATDFLQSEPFTQAETAVTTTNPTNPTVAYPGLAALTREARSEIERLTYTLFLTKEGEHRSSVLLGEIGESASSSAWLAIGVGAALAARGRRSHVLCLGVSPQASAPVEALSLRRPQTPGCVLEYLDRGSVQGDFGDVLEKRLNDLRSAGETVILHTENLLQHPEVLSLADHLDGVALIIRASHTRRAAIEAVRNQFSAAEIPLLGAVLVDRTFPIPEKLYRLL